MTIVITSAGDLRVMPTKSGGYCVLARGLASEPWRQIEAFFTEDAAIELVLTLTDHPTMLADDLEDARAATNPELWGDDAPIGDPNAMLSVQLE
jgi:hypothetical protein